MDISSHPLLQQCYSACLAIESIPASEQQTLASQKVNELLSAIDLSVSSQAPAIGQYWKGKGGIYAGIMRDGNRQWHLILASESIEPVIDDKYQISNCAFKGTWGQYPNKIAGEFSRNDGQHNTQLILAAEPENNLALSITSLNIDGHNDFYLPAQCENNLLFINLREHLTQQWHWSSTQYSARHAWSQDFADGDQDIDGKDFSLAARAVRRELII